MAPFFVLSALFPKQSFPRLSPKFRVNLHCISSETLSMEIVAEFNICSPGFIRPSWLSPVDMATNSTIACHCWWQTSHEITNNLGEIFKQCKRVCMSWVLGSKLSKGTKKKKCKGNGLHYRISNPQLLIETFKILIIKIGQIDWALQSPGIYDTKRYGSPNRGPHKSDESLTYFFLLRWECSSVRSDFQAWF